MPGIGPPDAGAPGAAALWGVAYLLLLVVLAPFGLHRLRLLWLRWRRPATARPGPWEGPLPPITVQLPVYDEANVVERLIDAACRLDYPRHLLEVQVLDDSDDETVEIAARRVARWRARGVDVRHVRRGTRAGFKAGALAEGARRARGEFFLVLDADFVPPPDLIRRLLPSFADPGVGAVQAAWDHLNREESWLTRAQALLLDAHFAVEHEARHRSGLFFNFNGSAGMWRRRCVEEAGGWQSDTLTEDLDLSYRAQLAGWRFVYRDDVRVPAELPDRMAPLEVQQERWAQGGIQTARKLLPEIWRSGRPLRVRTEATFHLLAHAAHPPTLLLGLCLCALAWGGTSTAFLPLWAHLAALGLAMSPFVLFYAVAARLRGLGPLSAVRRIGEAFALGLGLGVPVSFALVRGLSGARTPFRRTPKRGFSLVRAYVADGRLTSRGLQVLLALLFCGGILQLLARGLLGAVPFTGLFAAGYAAAAWEGLRPAVAALLRNGARARPA